MANVEVDPPSILAKLEAQPQRSVAVVFIIHLIQVVKREVSLFQLLLGEMSPYLGINAVTICDAKKTLCIAHHRTYTLVPRIDQMDARHDGPIGARHPVNIMRVLGVG